MCVGGEGVGEGGRGKVKADQLWLAASKTPLLFLPLEFHTGVQSPGVGWT